MLSGRRFSSVSGTCAALGVACAASTATTVYNPTVETRLRLLGSPQLEHGDAIDDLPVDKPASLLYYLAVRGDWVRRGEFAYLYRPDAPEEVALANVRVLLHRAKLIAKGGLEVERSRVRYLINTDVADFHRLAADGDLQAALALHRGPFLAGVSVSESPGYDTWLELERADLAHAWRAAALREGARLELAGEFGAAAERLKAVLTGDPLDEEALQNYLRVLFAAGRRSEARAAFDELRRTLAEELNAGPLESTATLFEALWAAGTGSEARVAAGAESIVAMSGSAAVGGSPSPDSTPGSHNLPQRTTRFHGRRREIAELGELLDQPDRRLVTITGLGGVGKSRLSLEVAAGQLPKQPDGVWLVELSDTAGPELLPHAIGSALRFDLANARDVKSALLDRMREKRTLLVLDNFEHLVDGAALLTELLEGAPHLKLLVTSRASLGLGAETIIELSGLAVPPREATTELEGYDAVSLFVDRAKQLSTSFVASGQTLEAVAELTRRVEGMPLALELAATWTRSLTVPELILELEGDLDLLAANVRDLPERQRSVRTVIDYSFRLLNDADRLALSRLSVFRGGFTREAAEQVADVHGALLLGLVGHSLISRGADGRFRLHELVRQFAAEKLGASEELRAAHSSYYLMLQAERVAALASSDRAAVLDDLLEEFDNIRAALLHAADRFEGELLTAALPALFTLYLEAGALPEITSVLEELAAEATRRGVTNDPLGLVLKQQLGRVAMSRGDFTAARVELEALVAPLHSALDRGEDGAVVTLARALDWLGSSARITGDLTAAEGFISEALALATITGSSGGSRSVSADVGLLADVTYNFALLREAQGRLPEALGLYEQTLASSLAAGDDVRAAVRRLSLAKAMAISGGDLEVAIRHLEEALSIGRAAKSIRLAGGALNALAVLAGIQGDEAGAERYNLESLVLARQQGQRDDQRVALANLGGILNAQGRLDEAAVYLRQALELTLTVKSARGLNQTYSLLGMNCSARGDHDGAVAYFIAALEPESVAGLPPMALTHCLSLLAKAHDLAGRVERARRLRTYLLREPATPPSLKVKIEAALAAGSDGVVDDHWPPGSDRPALREMAAEQRQELVSQVRS